MNWDLSSFGHEQESTLHFKNHERNLAVNKPSVLGRPRPHNAGKKKKNLDGIIPEAYILLTYYFVR